MCWCSGAGRSQSDLKIQPTKYHPAVTEWCTELGTDSSCAFMWAAGALQHPIQRAWWARSVWKMSSCVLAVQGSDWPVTPNSPGFKAGLKRSNQVKEGGLAFLSSGLAGVVWQGRATVLTIDQGELKSDYNKVPNSFHWKSSVTHTNSSSFAILTIKFTQMFHTLLHFWLHRAWALAPSWLTSCLVPAHEWDKINPTHDERGSCSNTVCFSAQCRSWGPSVIA